MGTNGGMLLTGRWARLARRWLAGLVLLIVAILTSFAGRLMIRRFLKSREAASYI